MICSHLVNLSLLLGAVLSYGLMWPLLDRVKGRWYAESLEESDMKSLYGYKVCLFVCLFNSNSDEPFHSWAVCHRRFRSFYLLL